MVEPTRRTGHRLGELAGLQRSLAIAALVAFGAVPFLAGARALQQGWQATGDVAIIAIRSLDAWTGDAPLVGQPTTGEEFTGTPSNHPGPVEFWVLGLTARAFGERAGIVAGAALINSGALLGIVWLAYRRGGTALLALVSVALAGLISSLGASSLYDPFNSELATYSMLSALLAAWCVAVGDLRVLPVLAVSASVAAQVHVAGAAFVAPLVVVAVISLANAWRRHPATIRRDRWHLLGALGVVVVAWLPPLAQEISNGPSNVAALWTTATTPRPHIGLSFILEGLATALAPIPTFLRSTGRLGFLIETSPAGVVVAFLLVGAIASLAILLRRRSRRSHAARLAALVLLATLTSVVAGAGQPPLAAFRADGTRWFWIIGLATWVTLLWEGWQFLDDHRQRRARPVIAPIGIGASLLVLAVALTTGHLADTRDGGLMPVTDEVSRQVIEKIPGGTYHVRFAGNQALVTVGPGIVYRLDAAGRRVRLDDSTLTRGYGPDRTTRGAVDGQLLIASGSGTTAPDGSELIAEAPVDPHDPSAGSIRVYLAP